MERRPLVSAFYARHAGGVEVGDNVQRSWVRNVVIKPPVREPHADEVPIVGGSNVPPGWRDNSSSWSQSLPIVGLAQVGTAMDEVLASLQHLRRQRDEGGSLWRAFWGASS